MFGRRITVFMDLSAVDVFVCCFLSTLSNYSHSRLHVGSTRPKYNKSVYLSRNESVILHCHFQLGNRTVAADRHGAETPIRGSEKKLHGSLFVDRARKAASC